MPPVSRRLSAAALALAVCVGAAGCGGDEPEATRTAEPTAQPTSTPTATSTDGSTDGFPGWTVGPTATPVPGLPTDFPTSEVPVLPGVVTGKTGGEGPDGRKGWVIEMSATGSQESCFDQAAAALVADGFTKQGEITAADTRQAQFTSSEYAVILSVRSDGNELCQASYEVGQVAR